MTAWFLKALASEAEEQKALWSEISWESGKADPLALAEFRGKSLALRSAVEATYEGLCEIHGQDPIDD